FGRDGAGAPPIDATRASPSERSVGTCSGTRRAMLPRVLLPASPYAAASGSSPTPTLSMTMTIARRKGVLITPLLMGKVIGDRLRRLDRRDRVLEDHVVGAAVIEHQREAIEVLDASLELDPVHHPDRDDELLAPDVVQKDILDVRLAGFGFGCGGHQRSISLGTAARSWRRRIAAAIVVRASPGPSSQTRLGSLRNQINWRRAYRRFSCAMSARVDGSS